VETYISHLPVSILQLVVRAITTSEAIALTKFHIAYDIHDASGEYITLRRNGAA